MSDEDEDEDEEFGGGGGGGGGFNMAKMAELADSDEEGN